MRTKQKRWQQKLKKLHTHTKVLVAQADVTKKDQVNHAVEEHVKRYGGVDVLVNGVGGGNDVLFLNKPSSECNKEIALNLISVLNCTRAVLPSMLKNGKEGGCIISIGSDAGRVGEYQESVYSASKAGVIAFSKTLAKEVGKNNIRLNVVCPALTVPKNLSELSTSSMWRTLKDKFTPEVLEKAKQRYPLRRLGTPEDVAYMVVFLASDKATFVTGQTFSVNGGYSML